ncbi:hypothetical protein Tco_1135312 [Tanacetum coccineum]
MTTLAENVIVAWADNRPPMLEKRMYNSWKSCMKLYIRGKEHNKDLIDSLLSGPFQYGTVVEDESHELRLPEWSKFVTDVKLARDMHESNFDQLYAYLRKYERNANSTGGNRNVSTNAANQTRVMRCYNFWGDGHMAIKCTQPKRPRNADWFKEKILLTDDLDAFDSDSDEAPFARAVLMANLSGYDLDVLLEVPISDTFQDNFVRDYCVQ